VTQTYLRAAEPERLVDAWHVVRTISRTGDRRLAMTFAGAVPGLTYIEPYLRDRLHPQPPGESSWVMPAAGLFDAAWSADADLVVAAVPRALVAELPRERSVVLPFRLHLVADLHDAGALAGRSAGGSADPPAGPSARERKRHRRRVRDYAYGYEVSHDPADFDWFYDRLHLPTMAARHGGRGRSVPKEVARRELFDSGLLFFVTSHHERVAAVLCHCDQARRLCNARLVGWLDGDDVHLQREALKTANHFLLQWARDKGFARVDFQGCEPFLSKGTFQSKRHLGVRVVEPPAPLNDLAVWLHVVNDVPAIRDFLVANPPVLLGARGELRPCYFFDAQRPPRLDLGAQCAGLAEATRMDLDALLATAARQPAPAQPVRTSPLS
jgi:hypothetical protein